jgi:hypothetical protein
MAPGVLKKRSPIPLSSIVAQRPCEGENVAASPEPVEPVLAGGIQPVNARTFTDCMEQLQLGYVAAIASTAGCTMNVIDRDTFGMDVLLTLPREPADEELSIYVQLKSTTTKKVDPSKPSFSYRFTKRVYLEKLSKPRSAVKAILVVMATDPNQAIWATGDHNALSVVNCCYWASFENVPVPAPEQPIVSIPTANVLSAEALIAILDRVEKGEPI